MIDLDNIPIVLAGPPKKPTTAPPPPARRLEKIPWRVPLCGGYYRNGVNHFCNSTVGGHGGYPEVSDYPTDPEFKFSATATSCHKKKFCWII